MEQKEKVIVMYFSEEQKSFMKKIGLDINFDNPTIEEFDELSIVVDDYRMGYGCGEDYLPNKEGLICDSILDIVSNAK